MDGRPKGLSPFQPRKDDSVPRTSTQVAIELDAPWLSEQLTRALKMKPKGGKRGQAVRGRLGYVYGVTMLTLPWFEAERAMPGRGGGWISFDVKKLQVLLATYSGPTKLAITDDGLELGRLRTSHEAIALRLGPHDPELAETEEALRRREAEALLRALDVKAGVIDGARWESIQGRGKAAKLIDLVHEGSVVLYETRSDGAEEIGRAVVEKKQELAGRWTLLCHDFRGNAVAVDPDAVTDLAL